jgi:hypothetical protein
VRPFGALLAKAFGGVKRNRREFQAALAFYIPIVADQSGFAGKA